MQKIPYAELASLSGEEFIDYCYLRLLRRQVDPTGKAHFLSRLEAGEDKAIIIGSILRSDEGRQAGEQVSGLWARYILKRLERLPLLRTIMPTRQSDVHQALRALENQLHRLIEARATPEAGNPAAPSAPASVAASGNPSRTIAPMAAVAAAK